MVKDWSRDGQGDLGSEGHVSHVQGMPKVQQHARLHAKRDMSAAVKDWSKTGQRMAQGWSSCGQHTVKGTT